MNASLAGRLVLVTGGARGIGAAIAAASSSAGGRVVVCDQQTRDEHAGYLVVDLAHIHELDRVVSHLDRLGGCDVLVNNAADVALDDAASVAPERFDEVMAVNVRACWYLATRLAPQLGRSGTGAVVNIGSTHPTTTKRASFPYNVSKGAALALTRALAVDLGEQHIRVNSVSPGIVDTEPTRQWISGHSDPAAVHRSIIDDHPMHRLPTPDDVAAAVVFLASAAAAGITGVDLIVDGGRQAMRR